MSVADAEADVLLFRGALDPRPGCAAVAVSTGRLAVLSKAVVAAADCSAPLSVYAVLAVSIGRLTALSVAVLVTASCSALLAAPEASGGSASCAALLALAPVWDVMLLLQSVLPSARTACCNSAIKVVNGRFSFLSF